MGYADMNILRASPVRKELLTPRRFTQLSGAEKANITKAEIVPPKLGEKGFGGVLVTYKNFLYKVG